MGKILEGKKCPSFSGECTSNKTLCEKDFIGKNLVIYFYLKIVHLVAQLKVKILGITINFSKISTQKL